jgi:hypothetical protein
VCDLQSGGRARLSGQPERSCALATTTVWPMKRERVKRCLVGGAQGKDWFACIPGCLVTYVVCLEIAEGERKSKSHVIESHYVDFVNLD